jgi:hypothetical protein
MREPQQVTTKYSFVFVVTKIFAWIPCTHVVLWKFHWPIIAKSVKVVVLDQDYFDTLSIAKRCPRVHHEDIQGGVKV